MGSNPATGPAYQKITHPILLVLGCVQTRARSRAIAEAFYGSLKFSEDKRATLAESGHVITLSQW